jgi:hypothetical protein
MGSVQVKENQDIDTTPAPQTDVAEELSLATSTMPHPDGWQGIDVVRSKLTEMYGDKAAAKEQEIRNLEERLIALGGVTHLLTEDMYDTWKKYILDSADYLTDQASAADMAKFEDKLQKMSASIGELEDHLAAEIEQGLFAVHKESGVRLYRQNLEDGSVKIAMATPDNAQYSEQEASQINNFIRNALGVTLPDQTFLQKAGATEGGQQLLACRISEITLNQTDDGNFEYSFETKVGTDSVAGGSRFQKISFTRDQVLNSGILIDEQRGFGYNADWPHVIVKRIPFGYDTPPELGTSHPAAVTADINNPNPDGTIDEILSATGDVLDARLTIPTVPPRLKPGEISRRGRQAADIYRRVRGGTAPGTPRSSIIVPGEPEPAAPRSRMTRFYDKYPKIRDFMNRYRMTRRLLPEGLRQVPETTPGLVNPDGTPLTRSTMRVRFHQATPRLTNYLNKRGLTRRLLPESLRQSPVTGPASTILGADGAPIQQSTRWIRILEKNPRLQQLLNRFQRTRALLPESMRTPPAEGGSGLLNADGTPMTAETAMTRFFNRNPKLTRILNSNRVTRRILPKSLRATPGAPGTPRIIIPGAEPAAPGRVTRAVQGTRNLGRWVKNSRFGRVMQTEIYQSRTSVPGRPRLSEFISRQPRLQGTIQRYQGMRNATQTRWTNFKTAHPRLASRMSTTGNFAKGTGYTAALIGIHKYCSGGYDPDAKHSYLPSLLRGSEFHKKLEALGYDTTQTTEEMGGMLPAFTADVASAGGDLGLIYGTAKGSQFAVWGTGKLVQGGGTFAASRLPTLGAWTARGGTGLVATSRGMGMFIRGAGKVAGLAYAPYAGYSYYADGAFIDDPDGDLGRVTGTIGEGFLAGCMVGGPWGGVAGATLSTIGAFKGSMDALDGVIESGRKQGEYAGVKLTLRRGMEGWRLPSGQRNRMTSEAREYISQVAKSQFIQDAIDIRRKYGNTDEIPFSDSSWSSNFDEYDDFAERVADEANGVKYYTDYLLWESDRYSPLADVPSGARAELVAAYRKAFVGDSSTQSSLTELYETSWQATSFSGIKKIGSGGEYEDRRLSAWQTFWGEDMEYSSKIVVNDNMQDLATAYHEAGFAEREQDLRRRLANGSMTYDDPAIAQLVAEERAFIEAKFPNLINSYQIRNPETGQMQEVAPILARETGFSQVDTFTRMENSDVRDSAGNSLKCSELTNSFLVEQQFGPSTTRMGQFAVEYHNSGLQDRDADIRQKLSAGELTMDSPEVKQLMQDQATFVSARIPNFLALIGPNGNRGRMEQWTKYEDPTNYSRKSEIMDSLLIQSFSDPTEQDYQQLAQDFDESDFAEREAALRDKLGENFTMSNPEVDALVKAQRGFIESRIPNFFGLMATEAGRAKIEEHTKIDGSSPIVSAAVTTSYHQATAMQTEMSGALAEIQQEASDKEFQQWVLSALSGDDQTRMAQHFSGEQQLSEEDYATLTEKAHSAIVARLDAGGMTTETPIVELNEAEKTDLIAGLQTMPADVQEEVLAGVSNPADQQILRDFWANGSNSEKAVALIQGVIAEANSQPAAEQDADIFGVDDETLASDFRGMAAEVQEEILGFLTQEDDREMLAEFWRSGANQEEAVELLKEVMEAYASQAPAESQT